MNPNLALRGVALFEFIKGLVVVLATTGVLALAHQDLHLIAVRLMEHTHLNPASHYPHVVLDALDHVHDAQLRLLALGAMAYATLRFLEAYGLWAGKAWAEVLAAGSGAVYVPFEIWELLRAPTWHGAALLVFNLAVVVVMLRALRQRRVTPLAPNLLTPQDREASAPNR
jgi:uncharacterized membrane protein (DUF2068 family)